MPRYNNQKKTLKYALEFKLKDVKKADGMKMLKIFYKDRIQNGRRALQ